MSGRNIYYEDENGDLESTQATAYDLVYSGPPKKIKTLSAGSGISITDFNTYLQIASSGVLSVGANVAATANSASITGTTLALAKASGSYRGVVHGYTDTSSTNIFYGGVSMVTPNDLVVIAPDMNITSGGSTQDNGIIITNKDETSLPSTFAGSTWLNTCNIAFTAPTTLTSSVVVGPNACNNGGTIDSAVVIGTAAGGINNDHCIYIGYNAGGSTNGTYNIGIGQNAYAYNSTGSGNVCVGYGTHASTSHTGNDCTSIGTSAGASGATAVHRLALGSGAVSDADYRAFFSTQITSIRATGVTAMKVSGSYGTGSGTALVIDANGNIYKQSSSARFKENISVLRNGYSERIYLLEAKEYIYLSDAPEFRVYDEKCDYCLYSATKDKSKFMKHICDTVEAHHNECPEHRGEQQKVEFGLVAEEVAPIIPEIVVVDETGPVSVDYARLTVLLIEEMKKLKRRIEILESKV